MVSLIDEYASIPQSLTAAFIVPRDSYDDLTMLLLNLCLKTLINKINSSESNNIENPEKKPTPLQFHLEMTKKHQLAYLEILRPYQDLAKRRPDLIPALRDAALECTMEQYPDDPFPPEQYEYVRQDIEALLNAVETGDICKNRI